ncbi:MAG: hypothetical protein JSR33_01685 [Proteobacteria bacterium]|nr:hypothetical protein [Pseudomonadota bacterium]
MRTPDLTHINSFISNLHEREQGSLKKTRHFTTNGPVVTGSDQLSKKPRTLLRVMVDFIQKLSAAQKQKYVSIIEFLLQKLEVKGFETSDREVEADLFKDFQIIFNHYLILAQKLYKPKITDVYFFLNDDSEIIKLSAVAREIHRESLKSFAEMREVALDDREIKYHPDGFHKLLQQRIMGDFAKKDIENILRTFSKWLKIANELLIIKDFNSAYIISDTLRRIPFIRRNSQIDTLTAHAERIYMSTIWGQEKIIFEKNSNVGQKKEIPASLNFSYFGELVQKERIEQEPRPVQKAKISAKKDFSRRYLESSTIKSPALPMLRFDILIFFYGSNSGSATSYLHKLEEFVRSKISYSKKEDLYNYHVLLYSIQWIRNLDSASRERHLTSLPILLNQLIPTFNLGSSLYKFFSYESAELKKLVNQSKSQKSEIDSYKNLVTEFSKHLVKFSVNAIHSLKLTADIETPVLPELKTDFFQNEEIKERKRINVDSNSTQSDVQLLPPTLSEVQPTEEVPSSDQKLVEPKLQVDDLYTKLVDYLLIVDIDISVLKKAEIKELKVNEKTGRFINGLVVSYGKGEISLYQLRKSLEADRSIPDITVEMIILSTLHDNIVSKNNSFQKNIKQAAKKYADKQISLKELHSIVKTQSAFLRSELELIALEDDTNESFFKKQAESIEKKTNEILKSFESSRQPDFLEQKNLFRVFWVRVLQEKLEAMSPKIPNLSFFFSTRLVEFYLEQRVKIGRSLKLEDLMLDFFDFEITNGNKVVTLRRALIAHCEKSQIDKLYYDLRNGLAIALNIPDLCDNTAAIDNCIDIIEISNKNLDEKYEQKEAVVASDDKALGPSRKFRIYKASRMAELGENWFEEGYQTFSLFDKFVADLNSILSEMKGIDGPKNLTASFLQQFPDVFDSKSEKELVINNRKQLHKFTTVEIIKKINTVKSLLKEEPRDSWKNSHPLKTNFKDQILQTLEKYHDEFLEKFNYQNLIYHKSEVKPKNQVLEIRLSEDFFQPTHDIFKVLTERKKFDYHDQRDTIIEIAMSGDRDWNPSAKNRMEILLSLHCLGNILKNSESVENIKAADEKPGRLGAYFLSRYGYAEFLQLDEKAISNLYVQYAREFGAVETAQQEYIFHLLYQESGQLFFNIVATANLFSYCLSDPDKTFLTRSLGDSLVPPICARKGEKFGEIIVSYARPYGIYHETTLIGEIQAEVIIDISDKEKPAFRINYVSMTISDSKYIKEIEDGLKDHKSEISTTPGAGKILKIRSLDQNQLAEKLGLLKGLSKTIGFQKRRLQELTKENQAISARLAHLERSMMPAVKEQPVSCGDKKLEAAESILELIDILKNTFNSDSDINNLLGRSAEKLKLLFPTNRDSLFRGWDLVCQEIRKRLNGDPKKLSMADERIKQIESNYFNISSGTTSIDNPMSLTNTDTPGVRFIGSSGSAKTQTLTQAVIGATNN